MPPHKSKQSPPPKRKEIDSDLDDDVENISSSNKRKKTKKNQNSKTTATEASSSSSHSNIESKPSLLSQCEEIITNNVDIDDGDDDSFIKTIIQTVKKLKEHESLQRLFSDKITHHHKELSIGIVKELKQVVDEFLVSVSQATVYMESSNIQTINGDIYSLQKIDLVEIWAQIFSFLPIASFFQVGRVCKLWNEATKLPSALVHYDYPVNPYNFSEKVFFDDYISFRTSSIISYNGSWKGIEWWVKKKGINARKVSRATTSTLTKDSTDVVCYDIEKTDTIFEKLERLECKPSPFIINTMSKSLSAAKQFPGLKYLSIVAVGKRTKEVVIAHPTLTWLLMAEFANIIIQCPMLETVIIRSAADNICISSKSLTKVKLSEKIGQLSLKEPTILWNAQFLEKVTSIVKFESPFVKSAFIGHECMLKYLPSLDSLTLNCESFGYECLTKLPSVNVCLKEISLKNFKVLNGELKNLKKILSAVEHVSFEDCSTEFVSTIMKSLSESLRSITLSKINIVKTIFDNLEPSQFPNLHSIKIMNLTKTLMKSPAPLEKMLNRMKSINKISLEASRNCGKINMNIPEHVTEMALCSVSLSGSAEGVKRLFTDTPHHDSNNCTLGNVELFGYFTPPYPPLKLHLLQQQMPSLKYIESFQTEWDIEDSNGASNIEFIKKEVEGFNIELL